LGFFFSLAGRTASAGASAASGPPAAVGPNICSKSFSMPASLSPSRTSLNSRFCSHPHAPRGDQGGAKRPRAKEAEAEAEEGLCVCVAVPSCARP
jgi:hypothetical protein